MVYQTFDICDIEVKMSILFSDFMLFGIVAILAKIEK